MALLDINWRPNDRTLRQFGWLACGALLLWIAFRSRGSVAVPLAAAVVILALSLVRPRWLKPLYVGLTVATFPIGWCVSNAMLLLVFGLIFTPLAVLFRLTGRDALHRRPDPSRASYWVPRGEPAPPSRYFRQS